MPDAQRVLAATETVTLFSAGLAGRDEPDENDGQDAGKNGHEEGGGVALCSVEGPPRAPGPRGTPDADHRFDETIDEPEVLPLVKIPRNGHEHGSRGSPPDTEEEAEEKDEEKGAGALKQEEKESACTETDPPHGVGDL